MVGFDWGIMRSVVQKFIADKDGATAIEYGLITALVSIVIVGALTTLGTNLTGVFEDVSDKLNVAAPADENENSGPPVRGTSGQGGRDEITRPRGGNRVPPR